MKRIVYVLCSFLLLFILDDSDELCSSPHYKRKEIKECDIAKHEEGIGYFLHSAEKRKLCRIIGGDVEHTEIIAGLTVGGIQVKVIHENISYYRYHDKAEEHKRGGFKLGELFTVASRYDEVYAHNYKYGMPDHRMKGHCHEVGIENGCGNEHYRKSADDTVKGEESIKHFPYLLGANESRQNGNVNRHGAELEGEYLKSVIAVELKPEELLEHLADHKHNGKYADHYAVIFGIMLFRNR